jgi:hypothetical protein
MGTLTSWNPVGHCRPVTGLLYLLRYTVHGEWHSGRITASSSHTTSEDEVTHSSYLTIRELPNSLSTRPRYKLVLWVKGNKTHLAESSYLHRV